MEVEVRAKQKEYKKQNKQRTRMEAVRGPYDWEAGDNIYGALESDMNDPSPSNEALPRNKASPPEQIPVAVEVEDAFDEEEDSDLYATDSDDSQDETNFEDANLQLDRIDSNVGASPTMTAEPQGQPPNSEPAPGDGDAMETDEHSDDKPIPTVEGQDSDDIDRMETDEDVGKPREHVPKTAINGEDDPEQIYENF